MDFDALVVGGGHAGIEAALALSRIGYSTMLVTQHLDAIGRLSCNPAVGGLSKGNIVREIDALGGEMGRFIDQSMIQFRILNRRRGPAVQAYRAQADKFLYSFLAKQTLERQSNLQLFQDEVTDLITEGDPSVICGVKTARGRSISAKTVVLTTGTFMEGKVFIGEWEDDSGRLGEPAAHGLGDVLRKRGFSVGRLKTGTPARVARSSINFTNLEKQDGDSVMQPFSFSNRSIDRPSVPCWITYTNEKTHQIINENMDRSPLYGGKIQGIGPRYCPSIEDKVVKFPDRNRHQIFIEPEGFESEEMYLNGISSSLPEEVQEAFLRTLPGLEDVRVMRPGYAVEYDFTDPRQLLPTLESKIIQGLFIAGQTNGTSGYEEAGCQGLIAGINAAARLGGEQPLVLSRAESYAGVLIDDLVTLGTEEPYRMFTSRAEYRLSLRHDTADLRLAHYGIEAGLVNDEGKKLLEEKAAALDQLRDLFRNRRIAREEESLHPGLSGLTGKTLEEALKVPEMELEAVYSLEPGLTDTDSRIVETAAIDIKYEGYLKRQESQINRFKKMEHIKIPEDFDYDGVDGLSNESRQKLKAITPLSVGQASRISGVRNSDIAVLMVAVRRSGNDT